MAKKRKQAAKADTSEEPPQKKQNADEELPPGVHHYQTIEEVPWDIQKYWQQGYSIFSKYDDGIWMTDGSWYEVTHESVAKYGFYSGMRGYVLTMSSTIAKHVAETVPADKPFIFDVMCGVGGNTIAFALSGKWKRVYAIEKNEATLRCAQHNAKIYGVADRITWLKGDCFQLLGLDGSDSDMARTWRTMVSTYGVVFASPPWGGGSCQAI
jgi:trimethylguanosine synthase